MVLAGEEIQQVPAHQRDIDLVDESLLDAFCGQRIGEHRLAQLSIGLADRGMFIVIIVAADIVLDPGSSHRIGRKLQVFAIGDHTRCRIVSDLARTSYHLYLVPAHDRLAILDSAFISGIPPMLGLVQPGLPYYAGRGILTTAAFGQLLQHIVMDLPTHHAVELEGQGEGFIVETVMNTPGPIGAPITDFLTFRQLAPTPTFLTSALP